MTRRAGFTLLELVVALVVTSVVASLAYATLQAGLDTGERVERSAGVVAAQANARALLVDALRHLPEEGGAGMGEVLFELEDRTTLAGLPADALAFLSHGLGPAPGTSPSWWVTLESGEDGVWLSAAPLDPRDGSGFDLRLPGARSVDALALARSADVEWTDRWDVLGQVPAAVRIQLLDERGGPLGPPLVVHAALEEVP